MELNSSFVIYRFEYGSHSIMRNRQLNSCTEIDYNPASGSFYITNNLGGRRFAASNTLAEGQNEPLRAVRQNAFSAWAEDAAYNTECTSAT